MISRGQSHKVVKWDFNKKGKVKGDIDEANFR